MIADERFDVFGALAMLHDALAEGGHVEAGFQQRLGGFGAHSPQARKTATAFLSPHPQMMHLHFFDVGDFSADAVQRLRIAQRVVLFVKMVAEKPLVQQPSAWDFMRGSVCLAGLSESFMRVFSKSGKHSRRMCARTMEWSNELPLCATMSGCWKSPS